MKMKNKQLEQAEAKRKHKEQLILGKRNSATSLKRREPALLTKPSILIVCEGENTEYSYFTQFKISTASVKTVGEGYNTLSLVERAQELSQEKRYDQVWCVFDADPNPQNPKQAQNFNQAIARAGQYGFKVAYSNQAFEYWLILHLDNHQGGGMDRKLYAGVINKLLKPFGVVYDGEGSKTIHKDFFIVLDGIDPRTGEERKSLAIKRAKRNCDRFDHANFAQHESSTTVYKLIEELMKYF